jgi:ABC-2 type transport system permease protein
MLNLINYEFKGMSKNITAIIASLFIMLVLTNIKAGIFYGALSTTVVFALGVAVTVLVIIECIKILGRYLYSNDGYLLFVTPVTGYEIIGSRLIVSVIIIAIVTICFALFTYFSLITKALNLMPELLNIKINISPYIVLYFIVEKIISIVLLLMILYFSMVLGKSVYANKKYEKLIAFIAFIIVAILISSIGNIFNNSLIVNISTKNMIPSMGGLNININGTSITNNAVGLNLGRLIYNLIISTGLFFATAYIIDNKLEI